MGTFLLVSACNGYVSIFKPPLTNIPSSFALAFFFALWSNIIIHFNYPPMYARLVRTCFLFQQHGYNFFGYVKYLSNPTWLHIIFHTKGQLINHI